MTASQGAPPDVVGPYLSAALGDTRWAECSVELISGGKSNLTYLVDSQAGRIVLRRPPLGAVLPTAHDMAREHTIIAALAGSDVPVPEALHLCTDLAVLGAPFHVMSHVDGPVVRTAFPPGYADRPEQRRAIGEELIDVLARLHAVDVDAAGLADFGRPAGFLARQMRRWVGQWEASRMAESPALDALAASLVDAVPESPAATIVHGDYRLDNTVLDPDTPGRIAAVLDWEMATVGDPLADLGLLLVYWQAPVDPANPLVAQTGGGLTALPGFPDRAQLCARYAQHTGRDLSALPWYVAFGCFKLAVVVAGIAARHRAGAMIGDGFEGIGNALEPLVLRGQAELAGGP
ncbi:MAG: phosphotransferase family protein [Actinomycetota bacterium]|nr:phosphotransferase family protein [Actinomycetota bacterium]